MFVPLCMPASHYEVKTVQSQIWHYHLLAFIIQVKQSLLLKFYTNLHNKTLHKQCLKNLWHCTWPFLNATKFAWVYFFLGHPVCHFPICEHHKSQQKVPFVGQTYFEILAFGKLAFKNIRNIHWLVLISSKVGLPFINVC